jgi:alpha-1,3-mannosyl-glycoprotein beta-1,2-N-acetylglucosaminyltransferase
VLNAMHIRNVVVPKSKSSSSSTLLPLSTSSSKGKGKRWNRFMFVLLFVWIVFCLWCVALYRYGFFSTTTTTTSTDSTTPTLPNELELINNLPVPVTPVQQPVPATQPPVNNIVKPPITTTTTISTDSSIIPILVIAYKRATELRKCLDTLLKYAPATGFQIYVSEDGYDESVAHTARSYGDKVKLFQHPRNTVLPKEMNKNENPDYYALSQHYQWAINQVFEADPAYTRIIILEEDLEVSPDFFSFFRRLSPYLDNDPYVFCISGWNDNGMGQFVKDNSQIYRSDFFPGLGWMINRQLWENELRDTWPLGYWDDWLREPQNRKGRHCLRPEINRTYTFGEKGTSKGQFFKLYLEKIRLNDENIDWDKIDLSYLEKDTYDQWLESLVQSAQSVNVHQLQDYANQGKDLKILYNEPRHYEFLAKQIGIMPELKAGVPRGAYHGVTIFRHNGNRVLMVPSTNRAQPTTYTNEGPFTK